MRTENENTLPFLSGDLHVIMQDTLPNQTSAIFLNFTHASKLSAKNFLPRLLSILSLRQSWVLTVSKFW